MIQNSTSQLSGDFKDWQRDWAVPAMRMRPLQLIHSFAGLDPQAVAETFKGRGLGGIVTNVSFTDYLRSNRAWDEFNQVLSACRQAGLRVWIYDEEGYPSGAAGGLVLAEDRKYEALALAYDPTLAQPFILRPAYEYTHAANNFHRLRRYPNLIDDRADLSFIKNTYDAYFQHVGADFGGLVEAFFTDEPSLIAVNLGQIPADAQASVPVVDALDASLRMLPMVPWVYDLPERYQERYGEDLLPLRRSLFAGKSPRDREVRRRYWALIGELTCTRYFGAIRQWCAGHNVAASGHCLREEDLFSKVPLEGSPIANLRQMHIPGMDLLTSDPASALTNGWLTALLPASAAAHNGTRLVMTEVSDFAHTWDHRPHADLKAMQTTAAWQAAFGVTEFTLYYNLADLPQGEDQAYTAYVGRLNALLRAAQPDRNVLLYYPIRDLWEEFLPVAEPILPQTQSRAAQRIVSSFMRLGQALTAHQAAFALIDHEVLAEARIENGRLRIGSGIYDAIILPAGAWLPDLPQIENWLCQPGHLIRDAGTRKSSLEITSHLSSGITFSPPAGKLVAGRFSRDGHPLYLVVNVAEDAYHGQVQLSGRFHWQLWHPEDGSISDLTSGDDGRYKIELAGHCALFIVGL